MLEMIVICVLSSTTLQNNMKYQEMNRIWRPWNRSWTQKKNQKNLFLWRIIAVMRCCWISTESGQSNVISSLWMCGRLTH